jgi:hypothetical protein
MFAWKFGQISKINLAWISGNPPALEHRWRMICVLHGPVG